MELIAIVSVVAAVLQIILFFKVWGMCDNVKKLSRKFTPDQNSFWAIRRALIIGDNETAKQLLKEKLLDDIQELYNSNALSPNPYNKHLQTIDKIMEQRIEKYKARFSKIGAKMPEITVRNRKDIDELI